MAPAPGGHTGRGRRAPRDTRSKLGCGRGTQHAGLTSRDRGALSRTSSRGTGTRRTAASSCGSTTRAAWIGARARPGRHVRARRRADPGLSNDRPDSLDCGVGRKPHAPAGIPADRCTLGRIPRVVAARRWSCWSDHFRCAVPHRTKRAARGCDGSGGSGGAGIRQPCGWHPQSGGRRHDLASG